MAWHQQQAAAFRQVGKHLVYTTMYNLFEFLQVLRLNHKVMFH